MKVDVVTPSLARSSGGMGPAISNLYENMLMRNYDIDFLIKTLKDGEEKSGISALTKEYATFGPEALGFSKSLMNSLINSDPDVVHTHGVWMATSMYQNKAYKMNATPFIISPHGMLDPWIVKRGKIKKLIARILYEGKAWKNCSVFHALTNQEAYGIEQLIPGAKIKVIPNGIAIPSVRPDYRPNAEGSFNILYLGRLHDKKNVAALIKAVLEIPEKVFKSRPFKLRVVGWGDGAYIEHLRNIVGHESSRVEFLGPLYGADKELVMSSAGLLVLPSFSEGLPVVVLEAWVRGVPVVMTDSCNLSESFDANAAVRVGHEVDDIKKILEGLILNDDGCLNELSDNGFDFVSERYNWNFICDEFNDLYSSVAG